MTMRWRNNPGEARQAPLPGPKRRASAPLGLQRRRLRPRSIRPEATGTTRLPSWRRAQRVDRDLGNGLSSPRMLHEGPRLGPVAMNRVRRVDRRPWAERNGLWTTPPNLGSGRRMCHGRHMQ